MRQVPTIRTNARGGKSSARAVARLKQGCFLPRLQLCARSSYLVSLLCTNAVYADPPSAATVGFGYFTSPQSNQACQQINVINSQLSVLIQPGNYGTATVTLTDTDGNLVANRAVSFQMLAGDATLATPSGVTDATGSFSSNVYANTNTSVAVGAVFDSGSGTPDTPVITGNPASFTFATGG